MIDQELAAPQKVQFSEPLGRGPFLGLSPAQIVVGVWDACMVLLVVFASGPNAAGIFFGLLLAVLGVLCIWGHVGDRTAAEWLPIVLVFWGGKLTGQLRYRSTRPWRALVTGEEAEELAVMPFVTALPKTNEAPPPTKRARHAWNGQAIDLPTGWEGPLAGMRLVAYRPANHPKDAPDFGVLVEGTAYRMVFDVTGVATILLLDDEDQIGWLDEWSTFLESRVGPTNQFSKFMTIVQASDDWSTDLAAQLRERSMLPEGHQVRVSQETFIEGQRLVQRTRRIWFVVELDMATTPTPVGLRLSGDLGACALLLEQAQEFASRLAMAHTSVNEILDPRGIGQMLRCIMDPYSAREIARRVDAGGEPGVAPDAVEPDALDADDWRILHIDRSWAVAGYVREWPHTPVHPSFLADLHLQPSCTYVIAQVLRPLPKMGAGGRQEAERAALKREVADATLQEKNFRISWRRRRVTEDVQRREAEVDQGAGSFDHNLFLLAAGETREEAEAAWVSVAQAAMDSHLEAVPFFGQQLAGLAAVLPFCRGV